MSFERTVPHLQDMDAADAVEFDIRKSTGRLKIKLDKKKKSVSYQGYCVVTII